MPAVFDETAIGLDHLAFAVPTRAELSDWERRFAAAGVIYTPAAGVRDRAWSAPCRRSVLADRLIAVSFLASADH